MGLIVPERHRRNVLEDPFELDVAGAAEEEDDELRGRGILVEEEAAGEETDLSTSPSWNPSLPAGPEDDKGTVPYVRAKTTLGMPEAAEEDAPEDEMTEEELMEFEKKEQQRRRDDLFADVNVPDDDFGTGAARDLWARDRVMDVGGRPFTETIDEVIEGIPTICSIILDFTPGVGDVKGLAEAIRGRDLVTDDELGWGSRVLGFVCLTELRSLGKSGKKARLVGANESYMALNDLAKAGGDSDPAGALRKALKEDPQVRAAVLKDARRRIMARNRRLGQEGKRGTGEALSDLAKKRKGALRSEVSGEMKGLKVRFDWEIKVTANRYLWEVKNIQWDAISYKKSSRVRARLADIANQVGRQRSVAGKAIPHEVWFWTEPRLEWQMDMILQWAKENHILITFDKPTILR